TSSSTTSAWFRTRPRPATATNQVMPSSSRRTAPSASLSSRLAPRSGYRRLLQRVLHRRAALFHHAADEAGDVVRQEVGDPDDAAAAGAVREDLGRRRVGA